MTQPEEFLPGITEEFCVPEFVDADWIKEPPIPVYRLDQSNHRYYYTIGEDGYPTFFTSVTTFISASLPTSPYLIQWYKEQGGESGDIAEERAHYGTFMHIQCAQLLQDRSYDLDSLPYKLQQYQMSHHLPEEFNRHAEELKRDVMSFGQFVIEKNVKPRAIEIVLTDDEAQIAGAIDLVCEMDYRGKPITAIVDLKSGRKGFYESHILQLHAYKRMWELHFPDYPIERVYNWSPKSWRGDTPTYNLKDQTSDPLAEILPHLVKISQIRDAQRSRSIRLIHGIMNLDEGLYSNVETVDLSEAVKKRHSLDDDDIQKAG